MDTGMSCCNRRLQLTLYVLKDIASGDHYTLSCDRCIRYQVGRQSQWAVYGGNTNLMGLITPNIFETFDKTK
jgi:hypothetical protein